jgi:hypothetical protein
MSIYYPTPSGSGIAAGIRGRLPSLDLSASGDRHPGPILDVYTTLGVHIDMRSDKRAAMRNSEHRMPMRLPGRTPTSVRRAWVRRAQEEPRAAPGNERRTSHRL